MMSRSHGLFGKFHNTSLTSTTPDMYTLEEAMKYPCGKPLQTAYFKHYALYLISSFGCVSNLLVIILIAYSKRVRNSVSGIFLLGLTVADTIVLISEELDNLTRAPVQSEKLNMTDIGCGFTALLKYSSRFTATSIVLCISFNRFMVILRPMNSHGFHQVKYAYIQVAVITFVSFLVCGIFAFSIGSQGECGCDAIDLQVYKIAITVVDVGFCDIVSSILISIFSICTIYSFRKYGQQLFIRQDSNVSAIRRQGEKHTTILLLTVAVTFVLLRIPYTVTWTPLRYMMNSTDEFNSHSRSSTHTTLYEVVDILFLFSLLNHAINLYLYCLCSRGFRKDFYKLIMCGKMSETGGFGSLRLQTMSTRDRSRSTTSTNKILT